MAQYQVTLICGTGQYKPVSTIITIPQVDENINLLLDKTEKKNIINKGIVKICQKRYWTNRDLKQYGYTTAKARVYDKEAIEKQNKERYEKLKEEKYACGEWKAPKRKEV